MVNRSIHLGVSWAADNGLLNDLAAYWGLQEAAGTTRQDSTASNIDLNDNNNVGQGTGHVEAFCADFPGGGSNAYLTTSTDVPSLDVNWTIAGWVHPEAQDTNMSYFGWNTNLLLARAAHAFGGDNRVQMILNGGGQELFSNQNIDTGSWYFVSFTYTAGGNITIRVNNNARSTAAITSALGPASEPLNLGQNTSGFQAWNGLMEQFGLWTRALSADDELALYNGGAGLTYAEFTT